MSQWPCFDRTHKASTEEDYGIDDLHSDDSSDDEDDPRKIVPSWAQGKAEKTKTLLEIFWRA